MNKKTWHVEVLNQHEKYTVTKEIVVRLLTRGLALVKSKHKLAKQISEIGVVFTDDKEIKRLNKIYRAKNKPTDVLSFSQLEGELGVEGVGCSLGDVIISIDTALKQAVQYKVTKEQEVLRLLMHGMLHLLGYDHVDVPEEVAEEMRTLEDKLQAELKGAWRKEWVIAR